MPECLNCHAELPAEAARCPRCGADPEELRSLLAKSSTEDRPRGRPVQPLDRRRPLPKWTRLLPLAGVVALVVWLLLPARFPSVVLPLSKHSPSAVDECLGRDACIVLFLAPWCPHCRDAIGVIRAIREKTRSSTRLGLRVVVGSDTEANLEQMAQEIGGVVFLDTERKLQKKLNLRGVPHWYLVSAGGTVRAEMAGASGAATIFHRLGAEP